MGHSTAPRYMAASENFAASFCALGRLPCDRKEEPVSGFEDEVADAVSLWLAGSGFSGSSLREARICSSSQLSSYSSKGL